MIVFDKLSVVDVAVILLYLAGMVIIGIFVSKRIKNTREFSSAGQSLSWKLVAGSTIATCMGANMVVGKYDLILKSGMAGMTASLFWWVGWLFLLLMAKRLRASGALSIPTFLEGRYGKAAQRISSYCVLIMAVSSCAAQFLSIGAMLSALGVCSMETGVWVGAAVVILFTVFSGLWGVAITDTIQSIVLLVTFGVVFPIVVIRVAGGWDAVVDFNMAQDASRMNMFSGIAPVTMIGWAFYYIFATGAEPSFSQRIFASRDTKSAVIGQLVAWGSTLLVVGLISPLPGLAIQKIFPEMTDGSLFTPQFLATYFPPVIRGLLLSALLGLMLTSGDTYLLLLSSTVTDDLIRPHMKNADDKKMLLIGRGLCFLSAVVICAMALYVKSIYQLFKTGGGAYGAGIFFPLILGCYWKKADPKAVTVAMGVGCGTSFIFDMFLKIPLGLDMDGVIIGSALCLVICVVGSLMRSKKGALRPTD